MGGSADWGRVNFCCDEEGDGVWAELVKERGEEVHCLKTDNVLFAGEVFNLKAGMMKRIKSMRKPIICIHLRP